MTELVAESRWRASLRTWLEEERRELVRASGIGVTPGHAGCVVVPPRLSIARRSFNLQALQNRT